MFFNQTPPMTHWESCTSFLSQIPPSSNSQATIASQKGKRKAASLGDLNSDGLIAHHKLEQA